MKNGKSRLKLTKSKGYNEKWKKSLKLKWTKNKGYSLTFLPFFAPL
jgi:hypothetical protein